MQNEAAEPPLRIRFLDYARNDMVQPVISTGAAVISHTRHFDRSGSGAEKSFNKDEILRVARHPRECMESHPCITFLSYGN